MGTFNHLEFPQNGGEPLAGLAQDKAGNLYGTARFLAGNGGVFSLTPGAGGNWTENVLHAFCTPLQQEAGCQDGYDPEAGVVFDKAGNLYGNTIHGTSLFASGTVFELTPGENGIWAEVILADGGGTGGVVLDGAGNVYVAGGNLVVELTP